MSAYAACSCPVGCDSRSINAIIHVLMALAEGLMRVSAGCGVEVLFLFTAEKGADGRRLLLTPHSFSVRFR